jgi:hypothetical protein
VQRPRLTFRRCMVCIAVPAEMPSLRLLYEDPDPALPVWSALAAQFLEFDIKHSEAVGNVLRRKQHMALVLRGPRS